MTINPIFPFIKIIQGLKLKVFQRQTPKFNGQTEEKE